ncbi:MAG TPA: hypothetical protein VGN37_27230 [Actinocatenispora sp.]
MTTINVDQFGRAVIDWAGRRGGQFASNWPVKGGWEGWIQVDLTAHILSADSAIDILREQPVFANSRQRCDLLLNTNQMPAHQIVVELKAQSFDNRDRFITGVESDLDKFNTLDYAYQRSTCVMLAMPFSPESLAELLGVERSGHRIFQTIFIGEVACAVAIRTADHGWLSPNQVPAPQATGVLTTPVLP